MFDLYTKQKPEKVDLLCVLPWTKALIRDVLGLYVCVFCAYVRVHPQVRAWNVCRMSSTFVTLAEVLEARGGPLLEEEVWSLLLATAESLVDVSYMGKAFQIAPSYCRLTQIMSWCYELTIMLLQCKCDIHILIYLAIFLFHSVWLYRRTVSAESHILWTSYLFFQVTTICVIL